MTATRSYQQHGLNALKRRVQVRGLDGIDKRTGAGRAIAEWRRELVADLGGTDVLSAQQRAVVEVASVTKLLHDSVSAWLLEQPSLVNGRRRTLYPVVLQRQQLADALARYMGQLGLERRAPKVPTLDEWWAQRQREKAAAAAAPPEGGPA